MNGKAAWLANHLIVYSVNSKGSAQAGDNPFNQNVSTVGTTLPIHEFDLRKIGDIINVPVASGGQGGTAKAYALHKLTGDTGNSRRPGDDTISKSTHPIRAYFLPWGTGYTFCGRLGTGANFFFTPTINGCTFAHDGGGPNPSVAHSNFVNLGVVDQTAINADLARVFGHAPASTVIRSDYKPAVALAGTLDYRATVVGIRNGNSWNFYYQRYTQDLVHFPGVGSKNVQQGYQLCVPIP
jgi:hypothetical protein